MEDKWPPRWRGVGRRTNSGLTRAEERWLAKRWHHRHGEWRQCYRSLRVRWCLRCWWREVTGQNARAKAGFLAEAKHWASELDPIKMRRREGGGWERVP